MLDKQAATVGDLAAEPELNCEGLGLTDTLLGDGQYGQTLLVRSCSYSAGLCVACHLLRSLVCAMQLISALSRTRQYT